MADPFQHLLRLVSVEFTPDAREIQGILNRAGKTSRWSGLSVYRLLDHLTTVLGE